MKIALACDHGGLVLKNAIIAHLKQRGIAYEDAGTYTTESVDYPVYAKAACRFVQDGSCDFGILVCTTGIGMSIVANKQKGIRAALVTDALTAEMCRRHNDANVLCFGAKVVGEPEALSYVDTFLATPFEGGRHQRRVDQFEN